MDFVRELNTNINGLSSDIQWKRITLPQPTQEKLSNNIIRLTYVVDLTNYNEFDLSFFIKDWGSFGNRSHSSKFDNMRFSYLYGKTPELYEWIGGFAFSNDMKSIFVDTYPNSTLYEMNYFMLTDLKVR